MLVGKLYKLLEKNLRDENTNNNCIIFANINAENGFIRSVNRIDDGYIDADGDIILITKS